MDQPSNRGLLARAMRQMADTAALLWIEARLTLGWPAILLVGAAALVFTSSALQQSVSTEVQAFQTVVILETLFFVILSMGLLPREKEANTLEVLLACARSRHSLLLMKFVPLALFVWVVGAALAVGFQWLTGGALALGKMLVIPFAVASAAGLLTVVLSTYIRNQYAAGAVAVLLLLLIAAVWMEPFTTFYHARLDPVRRQQASLRFNRVVLATLIVVLYDHSVRRLKRIELWMK